MNIMSTTCNHCGMIHTYSGVCHRIKSIEYHENGVTIKRVEYLTPVDYPQMTPQLQVSLETDENYRNRLDMIIGKASVNSELIKTAVGADLDKIGELYETKRLGA